MHTLSKSDFKLARTCAAKLYYRELGYPDSRRDDPYLDLLAEGGYMVELLAKQLFPDGVTLRYGGDAAADANETLVRLQQVPVTLFEATLLHEGRLARLDILRRTAEGFEVFEVKSSLLDPTDAQKRVAKTGSPFRSLQKPHGIASDWREYLEDVTYQVTILKDLFPGVSVRPHLILLDRDRLAPFDEMPNWFRIVRSEGGRVHTAEFLGDANRAREARLTTTVDVSNEVQDLEAEVRAAAAGMVASLHPRPVRMAAPLGKHCRDCEFRIDNAERPTGFQECWGARADARPHVLDLYQGRDLLEELIAEGVAGLADVREERLGGRTGAYAARQLIQTRHARSGQEWIDHALGPELSVAEYPLHFIDFEAGGLAIPHHRGMRPYGRIAWQWSCHTQAAPGAPLEHGEYLNTDHVWPNERFARTLRERLGDRGSILVWSPFEGTILRAVDCELTARGSDDAGLVEWLRRTSVTHGSPGGRILDLLALCRAHYFHPMMGRSNSIKSVLDALWHGVPEVRQRFEELTGQTADLERGPYASLPPLIINGTPQVVAEGTGAIRAYFAMVYGAERDDPPTRAAWSRLLLDYCRLDTLAMVLIWEHWVRRTGGARGV